MRIAYGCHSDIAVNTNVKYLTAVRLKILCMYVRMRVAWVIKQCAYCSSTMLLFFRFRKSPKCKKTKKCTPKEN